jgi:subtilase family serine protease
MDRKRSLLAVALTALTAAVTAASITTAATDSGPGLVPLARSGRQTAGAPDTVRGESTYCTLPDGAFWNFYHCYTPQDIRAAYGVDSVAALPDGSPNRGQGQTIVLVDSYGTPTGAQDLKTFHDQFFPTLPDPSYEAVYPFGVPNYTNANGQGQSGSAGAAGWTGEATLDIEWAYAIAPLAHIVLLAVPPAETEGVQGFPNLFKAISQEIDATPSGTVFSMSFGVTEQTFGGAAATQTAKFDAVFQKGLAKKDNFFASSGDEGSTDVSKQHRDSVTYDHPVAGWPASSPYVTAVGGTQLQYGWTWDPSSNDAYLANGSKNPAFWHATDSGNTQPVWNESRWPIGTGGGASLIYSRPSWQSGVDPQYGNHRVEPDLAWNAAVNGGVEIYISAFPQYNCGNDTGCWDWYGGTSAASPQVAGLTALANAARKAAGKAPLGFLNPILYSGFGSTSAFQDIVPLHYGSAPATFSATDVGVGTVTKSVGDLIDNQMWGTTIAGYPTTTGYDATTGWGAPKAPAYVAGLLAQP